MRNFLFVAALLATSRVLGADDVDHLDLVNASESTITSVAVAKADSNIFRTAIDDRRRPIFLESGETLTISTRLREGGCLRDLRVKFGNGKVLSECMFDICKQKPFLAAPPSR